MPFPSSLTNTIILTTSTSQVVRSHFVAWIRLREVSGRLRYGEVNVWTFFSDFCELESTACLSLLHAPVGLGCDLFLTSVLKGIMEILLLSKRKLTLLISEEPGS